MSLKVLITDSGAQRALGDFIRRGRSLKPALAEAGQALTDLVRLQFRASVGPFGQAWSPLTPATIKQRRKSSNKPLVDTGALQKSYFFRATDSEIIVGSDRTVNGYNLAAIHNFGTSDGRIPARVQLPSVRLPASWEEEVGDSIKNYLLRTR